MDSTSHEFLQLQNKLASEKPPGSDPVILTGVRGLASAYPDEQTDSTAQEPKNLKFPLSEISSDTNTDLVLEELPPGKHNIRNLNLLLPKAGRRGPCLLSTPRSPASRARAPPLAHAGKRTPAAADGRPKG